MNIIDARNVNTAVQWAIPYLLKNGIEETSRNGKVLVAPTPVTTIYNRPQERVLFSPLRDANPFFHLFESLWMLAGRNDVAFPVQFNKRFAEYSDDGKTVWGAYGWRWREFFGYDQLQKIIDELRANPTSRRCVLSMWNGADDVGTMLESHVDPSVSDLQVALAGGKDVPCNTHAYFDVRGGKLNMTVCCRSNDAIWGAYGANAVHFSILLEYMAEQVGVPMGVYRQMSNNFHVYLDIYNREQLENIAEEAGRTNLYNVYEDMPTIPLGSTDLLWHHDLEQFLEGSVDLSRATFFSQVAAPMYEAWFKRKEGRTQEAITALERMAYCDWQVAALDWVTRRHKEKQNAA